MQRVDFVAHDSMVNFVTFDPRHTIILKLSISIMDRKIFVVVGAKGGTGREIVKCLLEKDEQIVGEVRAIVRDPSKIADGTFPKDDARLKIIAGDCSKPDTLSASFKGSRAIFYTASGNGYNACVAVDREGPKEAATIAKEAGVGRFVLVSSQFVDPINKNTNKAIRGFLNTIVTGLFHSEGLMDFKFQGENYLRKSGLGYTIVRPGRLVGGASGSSGQMLVGQTNGALGKSNNARADVARVCVAAAFAPEALNTTFELGADEAKPSQTTAEEIVDLFKDLQKDEHQE